MGTFGARHALNSLRSLARHVGYATLNTQTPTYTPDSATANANKNTHHRHRYGQPQEQFNPQAPSKLEQVSIDTYERAHTTSHNDAGANTTAMRDDIQAARKKPENPRKNANGLPQGDAPRQRESIEAQSGPKTTPADIARITHQHPTRATPTLPPGGGSGRGGGDSGPAVPFLPDDESIWDGVSDTYFPHGLVRDPQSLNRRTILRPTGDEMADVLWGRGGHTGHHYRLRRVGHGSRFPKWVADEARLRHLAQEVIHDPLAKIRTDDTPHWMIQALPGYSFEVGDDRSSASPTVRLFARPALWEMGDELPGGPEDRPTRWRVTTIHPVSDWGPD